MIAPKLRFSEFKDEWKKEPLGKVVNFSNGKRIPLSEAERKIRQGEYRYYGASGVIDYIDDYIFDGQYILIGEDGANILNRSSPLAFVVNGKFWVNNHAHIFQSKLGNNLFLATYLESLNYEKHNSGTAQPKLNLENLKKVEVANPSTQEQTKIAEFLSAVDDKISQLSRELELLNQYKKGVMQKIFSQEIRFKNENGEDFGEWRTCNILEIADVSIGLVTTMTTNYAEIGVPLIRNSDIKQNKIRTSELIYLTPEFANSYENRKLKHKDIVTVHTGDVGVSSVIPQELHGSIGFATINTRVNENEVNPFYLSWFFNSENFINWCVSVSTGDGRQNLNLKDFNNAVIKLPIMKEQEKIAGFLTAIDERIDHTTAQLTYTKQWKKGLLQQMFV